MNWIYINQLSEYEGQEVSLKGWVNNRRDSKGVAFVVLRDGSGYCQCVIPEDTVSSDFELTKSMSQESSVVLTGKVVKDERQVGGYELQVSSFELIHEAIDYPITPKEHGVDFLLEQRHLWLRSKRQWAIMKVRNATIYAIHNFFQSKNFVQMDSPIFTGSAAEGTTDLFSTDYFGQEAYLAQTGQLYGEALAMAHGLIYTFGPTFRAEKSKTRRHLTEFWMIEPEMAFYDLDMDMDLIEEMLRAVVNEVVERCKDALEVLERDVDSLLSVNQKFPRITYDEAVEILKGNKDVNGVNSLTMLDQDLATVKEEISKVNAEIEEREAIVNDNNAKKGIRNFNRNKVGQLKSTLKDLEEDERNIPQWRKSAELFNHGADLGGSDETVLTRLFGCPIMVYNWPRAIKAFYMKRVEGNIEYVKGVDVLAPEGYGEIVGGSERETDLDFLLEQIKEEELSQEDYEWYLDLRRYGSVPHAGFGLGLERLITWICKLKHIREAIPFQELAKDSFHNNNLFADFSKTFRSHLRFVNVRFLLYIALIVLNVMLAYFVKTKILAVEPGSFIYNQVLLNSDGATIEDRFNTPDVYTRDSYDNESFGHYLRNMALKPVGSTVKYYDGSLKANNGKYEAVIDLPIGDKDLHQCADAVMHLWAEYLYKTQRFNDIHFNFTNGFNAEYTRWMEGERIKVDGNVVTWYKSNRPSNNHDDLDAYLERVYTYAGTMSLSKELIPIQASEMEIGDVFIQGGFPGHAVIVVDMATNAAGDKIFMLAQSYMPAQEIQILANPENVGISPWYELNEDASLVTPEWTFQWSDLKTFEYIN